VSVDLSAVRADAENERNDTVLELADEVERLRYAVESIAEAYERVKREGWTHADAWKRLGETLDALGGLS
jgi:hypothetical protein